MSDRKRNYWQISGEHEEYADEKQFCQKCGNDSFRVYIRVIIDDARLYCTKCGEPLI